MKVELDKHNIKRISKSAVQALEKTGEELHTRIVQAQVVPRDLGTLQGVAMTVDYSQSQRGEVRIVHDTPYARRLYFHPEYQFRTDENPNARGKWFEPWMDGGAYNGDIREVFAEFLKQYSEGVIR